MSEVRNPLFLTGMMGSGKSTVGRIVASRLGAEFVDLDTRIERLSGRTIHEILGESLDAFREQESQALVSLVDTPGFCESTCVVATGGGAVLREQNRVWMRGHGKIVYLKASASILETRLAVPSELQARPLLEGDALPMMVRRLLNERTSAYEACDVVVDANAAPERVAEWILSAVRVKS